MIAGSGRCHYHPERGGVGICVECRHVICRDCTTPFDGINRCAECLAKKLVQAATPPRRREWGAGNLLLAAGSAAGIFGALYGLAVALAHRG